MTGRLFHFSDACAIDTFVPRTVRVPSSRPRGLEWLNGALVWAIDDWHQPLYLFPRECPRILVWRSSGSSIGDVERYFGGSDARMIAWVEAAWYETLERAHLYRYELPAASFESLADAGMRVSRSEVRPLSRVRVDRLPAALAAARVELRVVESLTPLRGLWATSLQASGIRLRNAAGW